MWLRLSRVRLSAVGKEQLVHLAKLKQLEFHCRTTTTLLQSLRLPVALVSRNNL